jgi:hypothetical protein
MGWLNDLRQELKRASLATAHDYMLAQAEAALARGDLADAEMKLSIADRMGAMLKARAGGSTTSRTTVFGLVDDDDGDWFE